jgi:hypothetical protein
MFVGLGKKLEQQTCRLLAGYAFDCRFETSEAYGAPAVVTDNYEFDELVVDYFGVDYFVGFFTFIFWRNSYSALWAWEGAIAINFRQIYRVRLGFFQEFFRHVDFTPFVLCFQDAC